MCVIHIYTDCFPNGHTVYFRRTRNCQLGTPSRPCHTVTTRREPTRNINWGELTSEQIYNPVQPHRRPLTPPHSPPASSHHRHSSSESKGHQRRRSKNLSPPRATREHRKTERIFIVEPPPTPYMPSQIYNHTFTAPSSPIAPPSRSHERERERERGRPVIVDEGPLRRNPSVGAVVGDRLTPRNSREYSRTQHVVWDSPSTSHTSFNSRLRREEEELMRTVRAIEAIEAQNKLEKEKDRRRKEELFRRQDEEIRSRPAVPLVAPIPPSLRRQQNQSAHRVPGDDLPRMMGGLDIRENHSSQRREQEVQEARNRRLRERRIPGFRASVGPGHRQPRVAYDDGYYVWE